VIISVTIRLPLSFQISPNIILAFFYSENTVSPVRTRSLIGLKIWLACNSFYIYSRHLRTRVSAEKYNIIIIIFSFFFFNLPPGLNFRTSEIIMYDKSYIGRLDLLLNVYPNYIYKRAIDRSIN
jgi:ABC-type transport system involved in multi-copper enzyme maturation permease subunit